MASGASGGGATPTAPLSANPTAEGMRERVLPQAPNELRPAR